ncbi:circumsporozoite protein [Drosophila ficusphila]|uniref:circumsporozoite protein n=1 Tax=Drosophila ficusphila TaxID=30025 RepID=UPI001C8926EA|nr:circumsporozoite protein [Drosophila ficusphila]
MSNGFSFWNGQPVTSPVYPQMGDAMSPNANGYSGGQWFRAAAPPSSSPGMLSPTTPATQAMGDFRSMGGYSPMAGNFFWPAADGETSWIWPEPEHEPQPQPEPGTDPESQPESESQSESQSKSDSGPGSRPGTRI